MFLRLPHSRAGFGRGRALSLAAVALAFRALFGCGVDDYHFVPDEVPDASGGGGGTCPDGGCGPLSCETGVGDCDEDPENGCETDLLSNPTDCGRCRLTCASGHCSGGVCTSTECPDGFSDCNQEEADRCEANLSSISNCQMCGKECSDIHGEPSCTSGGCAIACEEGYGDCDEEPDTGCETDLTSDLEHCGACEAACSNENGSTRCVEGECEPTCERGFDDCDGDPSNGCETDLGSAVRHCGACGERCAPAHATGMCVDGECEPSCSDGYDDCNGDPSDGCEADLTTPENCGSCTVRCSDNGGTPRCSDEGECEITCNPGRGDCINGVLDGCETNTNVSVVHCGTCGHMCPGAVGTPACFDGVCGVSTCTDPFAECDADSATSCETDLTRSPRNCGACGTECFYPQGTGVCVNRSCMLGGCSAGWADCSATALGCETELGTNQNCGRCGGTCANAHGTTTCGGAPGSFACTPTCADGWFSCSNPDDGCETDANVSGLWAVSGNGRVTLGWRPVAAATSYVVRRGTASGGPFTNVATGVTGTTTVNMGVTNGTTYYYVVAAVVPCDTGPNSAPVVAIPDGALVAHWAFDETSGTSAADSSGNGRTATLSGATFTSGRRNNAVRIAGGTQRVNLPANVLQGCTDLTIATWLRLTTNTGDWARIFDIGSSQTNYAFLTPRADATNVLRFAITTSGGAGEQVLSYAYTFPTATYKHVAIVLAGNTGRLYLDGAEVAVNTGLTMNPNGLGATPNAWLGDSQYPNDPTLDGTLDDFRISCRAYGSPEIAALLQ